MLQRSGTVHSTKKFRHLISDNCIASHGLPNEKKDGFLHIFKEGNGVYVSVRQRIESFESGGMFLFPCLRVFLHIGCSPDPIFALPDIKAF